MQAPAPSARFDPHPALLERESQMRRISAALRQHSGVRGELIALAGGAGTGRTRLLREAMRVARKRSMHVVDLRLGRGDDNMIVAGLGQRPVVPSTLVAVDDLHCCGAAAMPGLARGVGDLRQRGATVLVSCRDRSDLDGMSAQEPALVLQLGPLRAQSTASLLARALRTHPADELAVECQSVTGGNPRLVCELALALAGAHPRPTAESVRFVRQLGLAPVGRRVLTRIGRHDLAKSLLVAAAVLGERATIATVVAIADEPAGDCAPALDELRREGLLVLDDELLRFATPLIPRSIVAAVRPSELCRLHRRAAEVLEVAEAPFEEIAEHLARSSPAADRSVVGRLRLGAHRARQVGDARGAAAYLRRALEEGADEFERDLVLELAAVEAPCSPADAIVLLDRAIALTRDPGELSALAARRERIERALLACAQS